MPQIQNPARTTSDRRGVSRRTVAGAAAWSIPAIVLTMSSPAAAVSTRGVLAVAPRTITIDADTTRYVEIQTAPVAADVTVTVVVEPAGALTWTPDPAMTLPGVGSATLTFSTTLTKAGEATVTVSAAGFEPVVIPVVIEAPATVLTLSAPAAPVNLARSLPMLDHRQDVAAQLARRDGSPVAGETVTLIAPAGTTFADGRSTYSGMTDDAGALTATLLAPDDAPAATKVITASSRYAAEATLEFIVIGPEQTVAFDLPAVTKSQSWEYPAGVWIAIPERVTDDALDVWMLAGAGQIASGTWLTSQLASKIGWAQEAQEAPGRIFEPLHSPVAARPWPFTFRNISGAPGQALTMIRKEWNVKNEIWEPQGEYPVTLS